MITFGRRAIRVVSGATLSGLLIGLSTTCAHAVAATPSPAWKIESFAYPSTFSVNDSPGCNTATSAFEAVCDTYAVTVTNIGGKQTNGGAVTIEDTLPTGVTAQNVSLLWSGLRDVPGRSEGEDLGKADCTIVPVKCKIPAFFFAESVHRNVQPDDTLKIWISVTVNEPSSPATLVNTATVLGGGAAQASTSQENAVAAAPATFGFTDFSALLLDSTGTSDSQAGAHPYELATQLDLNSFVRESPEGPTMATTTNDVRDVVVDLPLGLAGSAVSAPTCTLHQLSSRGPTGGQGVSGCPPDTAIGHIRSYPTGFLAVNSPIYNIVPERGVAGEFGFIDNAGGTHVLYASLAPTPAGYVLRTTSRELAQVPLDQVSANIYGDPAARDGSSGPAVPTFTNPEDCSGQPLKTTVHMDSWASPGRLDTSGDPDFEDPSWVSKTYESPPVIGCSALEGLFNPSIDARPEVAQADSPTGLAVDIAVPQATDMEALGTPPLRDAVVTLPEGMAVNPSSANGLQVCSLAQVGMSASGVPNAARPECPDASKIGTVELDTPALPSEACKEAGKGLGECPSSAERETTPLEGAIYLAKQGENPFNSLLAIYIAIDDPRTGVIVKLAGEVKANATTGQLTTVVRDSPQFPFSELRTHFFGGSTASLRTPASCGTYTVSSELAPWSAPESGPPATPSVSFDVNQGAGGGACASLFAPSLTAGTSSAQAAAYSPFSVAFSRQDADQTFSNISVTAPPGLLGSLRNVVQCPEPQAARGECGPESRLGSVTTAVGAGQVPYWVRGGNVFLTGPYAGGPFGLSIVVPTVAGPFTLTGNGGPGREIVRASIRVDSHTAQITVVSDPVPTIIEGIPLDIRTVNVNIDRPGFIFNPTNCTPLMVSARITSEQSATAALSTPFHASNCAHLPFRPKLTGSVVGKASKANGVSLTVKVTSAGLGESGLARVDLQLPKALPSRLTTIQKACLASVFDSNPAGCNIGSVIGMATIHTPLLAKPLIGPAYLVSHGGAAFPDVEFVLQGEGVTLDLDGKSDIKKGITYARFDSTPDAPFTSFEAILPAGPHSQLTADVPEKAHYSLCKTALAMPTEMVGQNGALIKGTTRIAVTGCPKAKVLTRAQKLTAALKRCHKYRKASRAPCEQEKARKKASHKR